MQPLCGLGSCPSKQVCRDREGRGEETNVFGCFNKKKKKNVWRVFVPKLWLSRQIIISRKRSSTKQHLGRRSCLHYPYSPCLSVTCAVGVGCQDVNKNPCEGRSCAECVRVCVCVCVDVREENEKKIKLQSWSTAEGWGGLKGVEIFLWLLGMRSKSNNTFPMWRTECNMGRPACQHTHIYTGTGSLVCPGLFTLHI